MPACVQEPCIGNFLPVCASNAAESARRRKMRCGNGHSIGVSGFVMVASVFSSQSSQHAAAQPLETEVKAIVSGNTDFALDLYARLRTKEGNVFFSPYS